jgi:hypothetical protein
VQALMHLQRLLPHRILCSISRNVFTPHLRLCVALPLCGADTLPITKTVVCCSGRTASYSALQLAATVALQTLRDLD